VYNGILGINNIRYVAYYVNEFSLRHITTGDLLIEAFKRELITEQQGNQIWADMIKKRRKIGANSFTEFLKIKVSKLK